ncbi:MAG: PTS sugar transporter subunit IIA [Pseudomonadota bacterium]
MQILDILTPARVQAGVVVTSKKRVLEHAAKAVEKALGASDMAGTVFDALLARERLGSTALGEGVAVPHCRLAGCTQTVGLLLRLAEGIDYDAPDGRPVDLLFVLVVPQEATDEHLQLLGRVAGMFNDPVMRADLRAAQSGTELFERIQTFERDAGNG